MKIWNNTPAAKKIHPFASAWYEIRLLWPNIKPVKSHTTTMGFKLQTDMNQIFQMRYFTILQVMRLQKYQRSKLEVDKKSAGSAGPGPIEFKLAELAIFFATSNFDLKYFCNLLTYKNVQYLIWKIWFISVWSQKLKGIAWLLSIFLMSKKPQITP